MRTLFALLILLLPLIANGQGARAMAFTTNTAPVVTNMVRRIAALYETPSVVTFVNDQTSVEQGATVASTLLTWTLTGNAPTAQYLNQGIGSIGAGLLQYTHVQNFTTSRTYVLTVTDGIKTNTSSTGVTFYSKAYWGPSSDPTPDDPTLLAMSQEFASGLARTKSITAAGEYIIVAYPASFGLAEFRVNGFIDTAWTLEVRNVVNASLASVSYNVYHSNEPGLGTFEVELY